MQNTSKDVKMTSKDDPDLRNRIEAQQNGENIINISGQEATVRTGHGTTDCFQIGIGLHQGCILSPCLFNLYAEYIM